jgi:hypothetical protein
MYLYITDAVKKLYILVFPTFCESTLWKSTFWKSILQRITVWNLGRGKRDKKWRILGFYLSFSENSSSKLNLQSVEENKTFQIESSIKKGVSSSHQMMLVHKKMKHPKKFLFCFTCKWIYGNAQGIRTRLPRFRYKCMYYMHLVCTYVHTRENLICNKKIWTYLTYTYVHINRFVQSMYIQWMQHLKIKHIVH